MGPEEDTKIVGPLGPPLRPEAPGRLKLGWNWGRPAASAAPWAGKGRAEWSFLEEERKSCPFLEVEAAAQGGGVEMARSEPVRWLRVFRVPDSNTL